MYPRNIMLNKIIKKQKMHNIHHSHKIKQNILWDNIQIKKKFIQHIVCEWKVMSFGDGDQEEGRKKGREGVGKGGKEGRREGRKE